ncbi:MAG: TetR/AcrR family transcriptional regulator [Actinobacteria bacterium]|nr:TetR/AcrR family transcriptional regulator [Actinomycetota bacterium]
MTDDRRLTVQGQERKEQLLDCAAVLFAERGYAETRVLDIVRAAGVAKGLFYWYFENKEALFRELVEQNRHRLRKAQADAIDPDAEALLQIRQGADASLRFMSRYAHFFALLEVENADRTFTEERRKGTELHTRDVARLIRAGIADGTVRDEDPELLAHSVVGTVGYYGHLHRTGRVDLPDDELAGFVGRLVVCSLASHEDIARRVLAGHLRPQPLPG